jgi:5-methylcytosine-specific restriction enzyme A
MELMPLLYYWRSDNFKRDRSFGFGFHLNQNSPAMAGVAPGDSLWAFTRRLEDGVYVLAAELVVRALTRNPHNFRYGSWRVWGDLHRSRYFNVELGPRIEPVVRTLGIRAGGSRLGGAFQGHAAVRSISEDAHRLLKEFSEDLPLDSAAAMYPEDEFEARLVHDQPVRRFLVRESRPEYDRRLRYLYETVDVQRARRHVEALHDLYHGKCQICLYDPRGRYGHRLCHGHHIEWLSRGGEDELGNMMLVCPNHHSAIHRDDAPFDFADFAFTFSNGLREALGINRHLAPAVLIGTEMQ